jgi:3-phosphoglycerate kinase
MRFRSLDEADFQGKRVLLRVDLNVPMQEGKVADATRIVEIAPTITEIAGKDVWITISGHMGEKDGYATFDPTEFKVGDTEVPVAVVNPLLQKKLAEERDRLKIPNSTGPQ